MGILRLTQDIAPFAQHVILGKRSQETHSFDKVVIDGPSLVYHVYHLALRWHQSQSPVDRNDVDRKCLWPHPPYHLINELVFQFLRDLEAAGTTVTRIFFDGGLPISKQSVRRQRVEKNRQQLDKYRQAHPSAPPAGIPVGLEQHSETSSIIWHARAAVNASGQTIPVPFLVPSVIESLSSNEVYNSIVEVVPGESDPYCAALAASDAAVVLSNDSDLVLYDLGRKAFVVPFNSLRLETRDGHTRFLSGSGFNPPAVAKGLGVVQLREFGFQRYLDGQATTMIIAERARVLSTSGEQNIPYQSFSEDYATENPMVQSERILPHCLSRLDPRTAELLCALILKQPLQVYFPVLLEDASRDSAWSYGRHIRQLGYSILMLYNDRDEARDGSCVSEYVRSGRIMKDLSVSCLSQLALHQEIDKFIDAHEILTSNNHHLFLGYHSFAAYMVESVKRANAKSCLFEMYKLFGCNNCLPQPFSWEDIHLLACLHAVLYSIRMFQQLLRYASLHLALDEPMKVKVKMVVQRLSTMPSIEDLFLSPALLSQKLRGVPQSIRDNTLAKIEDCLKAKGQEGSKVMTSRLSSSKVGLHAHRGLRSVRSDSPNRSREAGKKRRNSASIPLEGERPGHSNKRQAEQTKYNSQNRFAALQNG